MNYIKYLWNKFFNKQVVIDSDGFTYPTVVNKNYLGKIKDNATVFNILSGSWGILSFDDYPIGVYFDFETSKYSRVHAKYLWSQSSIVILKKAWVEYNTNVETK